ncbi:calcium-binding protein [Catellatospora sp. NPDC049609]|uniref:calcium-binding protein n=1 Tax=Catellatospora sp. NPDC049609 TaxID=3155505 RepID=UPI00341570B2
MRIARTALAVALTALSIAAVQAPAHAAPMCNEKPVTHLGTAEADVIVGTPGDDVILALGGDDTISGLGGNDVICAGEGNDTVYGESAALDAAAAGGSDTVFGGPGDDLVVGDFGAVEFPAVTGGTGWNDSIYGGEGNDTVYGDAIDAVVTAIAPCVVFANDGVFGGPGLDTLHGDARTLTFELEGTLGVDAGSNTVSGGEDNDTVYGNFETVTALGTIGGSGGRDNLTGGVGDDTVFGDARTGAEKLTVVGDLAYTDIVNAGDGADTGDAGPGVDICANVETATNCEA